MDSFQRNNQEEGAAPKQGGTKPLKPGTGQLSMDSFKSTGTGPLTGGPTGTRRLASGPLEMEKTLSAMRTEVENGNIILGKLEARITVMRRALGIADRPLETSQILAGVGAGEAGFTKQVAQMMQGDAGAKRRVQVAVYQFDQARKGLQEASQTLERVNEFEGAARVQFVDSQCHVEKLRGQLYPLINLHVVFKDNPLLAQLIPTPKIAPGGAPQPAPAAPQPGPAQAGPAAGRGTGSLGTGQLAQDPAVQEIVDTLNRVTGNLKDKFLGAFGKKRE